VDESTDGDQSESKRLEAAQALQQAIAQKPKNLVKILKASAKEEAGEHEGEEESGFGIMMIH
jgi:hypothetical protein